MNPLLQAAESAYVKLQADPLLATGLGLVILIALIASAATWRIRTKDFHLAAIARFIAEGQTIIKDTGSLFKRMLEDTGKLLTTVHPFDGFTRNEYEADRKVWARWLSQRQILTGLLKQVEDFQNRQRKLRWWQFSLSKLKFENKRLTAGQIEVDSLCLAGGDFDSLSGAAEVNTISIPRLLIEVRKGTAVAERELNRFQEAVKTAENISTELNLKIDGNPKDRPGNLEQYKQSLQGAELPLTPYQARLSNLNAISQNLCKLLSMDPLSDHSIDSRQVENQLSALMQDLAKAMQFHQEFVRISRLLSQTRNQIDELRATRLSIAIAEVTGTYNWTLSEDGFNPDPKIDLSATCLDRIGHQLEQGQLLKIERALQEANNLVSEAVRLVEETKQAKESLDLTIISITAESQPADLEADREDRQAIADLYAAQKWKAATAILDKLDKLHQRRKAERRYFYDIYTQLDALFQELTAQTLVVSTALEERYAQLVEQLNGLKQESTKGRANWDDLHQKAATLLAALVGKEPESVIQRMAFEVKANQAASTAVSEVQTELLDLEAKILDKWGAEEAARLLGQVEPDVSQVIADGARPKLDWSMLEQRARTAFSSMSGARKLVDQELAIHRSFLLQCQEFENLIKEHKQINYERRLCTESFGAALYCPVSSATTHHNAAMNFHQQRNYKQLQDEIEIGKRELTLSNLETWWMCLQAVSLSSDPCAQKWAAELGYIDGRYSAWRDEQLPQCQNGRPFKLPQAAPTNLHKTGRPPLTVVGDAPRASDYLSGVGLK